jgi:hypothetical protein
VSTDIQDFPRASCRHAGSDASHRPLEELSGVRKRLMSMSMPTSPRPQQPLRPPASEPRPAHGRRDHRHGPRRPSLHGAWLVECGADRRGLSGCGGPRGAGAPTGGLEAAPTRPEAHGAAPARADPATNLQVSPHRRAPAGRTRQDPDPARRGSCPIVCAVAVRLLDGTRAYLHAVIDNFSRRILA